jgi:hypothetical protein
MQQYKTTGQLHSHEPMPATLVPYLPSAVRRIWKRIAGEVKADMASVIVGQGPEPWVVDSRHWQTHEKIDLVVNDENVNMTRLAEWTHAARYALPSYLTPSRREQLEIELATPEPDGPDFG